ncbi:hypothetical protein [Sphingomonas bacterium]|uniref:hypothetical protein n=1 Tax=Sphingomonas bacterium TaxID=1895847 RepID=UPI0015767595|nr:hypothetical protein [Sphingomonas bacterium]
MFSLKHGNHFTPWYVGKTCSEKGFYGEVLQGRKLAHYYAATDERYGREYLHLVARIEENRGGFCKWSQRSATQIERVESHMIGMAIVHNERLRNSSKTKFHRTLDIAGVVGPKYQGRPSLSAQTLKNVLGLTKE